MSSNRYELYRKIMDLYPEYLIRFPQSHMTELLLSRYGVGDMRLMTVEQVTDFLSLLESTMSQKDSS